MLHQKGKHPDDTEGVLCQCGRTSDALKDTLDDALLSPKCTSQASQSSLQHRATISNVFTQRDCSHNEFSSARSRYPELMIEDALVFGGHSRSHA